MKIQTVLALAVAMLAAASPPAPAITLKVWNGAHLDEQTLLKTKKEAAAILGQAGIGLVWVNCVAGIADWTSKDPCLHESPGAFQVSITADKPPHTTPGMVGFTEVEGSAGVYYPTVVLRARYFFIDASKLLAAAIVHEVGHMILGANAHSSQGLMCALWGPEQFELIGAGKLEFSREQAKLLQREVKRRFSAEQHLQINSGNP